MFKETARVTGLTGKEVLLKIDKQERCGCCGNSFFCLPSEREVLISGTPDSGLAVGDRVELGIEEYAPLLVSVMLFFLPIVIFIAALMFFGYLGELKAFFAGLGTMAVYYLLLKIMFKKIKNPVKYEILRKL